MEVLEREGAVERKRVEEVDERKRF